MDRTSKIVGAVKDKTDTQRLDGPVHAFRAAAKATSAVLLI